MTRLTVRRGSTGRIVAELQKKLNILGYYHGKQNGTFDAETEKAVIALQRAEGLKADGNVGIETWYLLNNKRSKPQPPSLSPPPPTRRGSTTSPIRDVPNPPPPIFPMPKNPASKPVKDGADSPNYIKDYKTGSIVASTISSNIAESPVHDETAASIKDLSEATQQVSSEPEQHYAPQSFDVDVSNAADSLINEEVAFVIADSDPLPQDSSPLDFRPVLQLGDSGSAVQTLQMMLQILGYYSGRINGVFDSAAEQAIIAFQRSKGLKADGTVSPDIWTALDNAITDHLPEQSSPLFPSPESRPSLRLGDTGETVQILQMMVQLLDYYDGPVNSVFDIMTMQAVTAFQNGNGLVPNGVVDSQTWKQLDNALLNLSPLPPVGLAAESRPSLLPGDIGDAVKVLQMMLYILGFYSASINSIFDEATKQAVIDFQKHNGLPPANIVGSATWEAINNAIIEHIPASPLSRIPSSSSPALSVPVSSPLPSFQPVSKSVGRATVRLGDTGADVEQLKKALADLGYYTGPVNQTFDALLTISVTDFQRDNDLVPDGIAGSLTWAALDLAMDSMPSQPARPTLRPGDISEFVLFLQNILRFLGYYNDPITKQFTAGTQAAVKQFQRDKKLVVDGIVGPLTWAALDEEITQFSKSNTVRLGDTGYAVERLQRLLANIGLYKEDINGIYSEQLANAVRKFQSNQGLTVDGITGPITWQALESWQALHARDKISLCWVQNPGSFAVKTDAFNVISPVWYDLSENGDDLDINPRQASAAYTQAAHKRGISVWGTIQSFNAALTRRLVTSDTEISQFISKMKGLCAEHQLDGLCIDFEYMYVEDRDKFTEFVRRVAAALKNDAAARNNQFVVSVCFSSPPHPDDTDNMWSAGVDRAELGSICDYCCLMLYDETGPDSGAGPVASQSWAIKGLPQTLEQVPQNVLLLGVPFYSAEWSSQKGSSAMYLTMDMIQSLLDNEYFTDRNGNTIKVRQYIVQPVYQDGELHAEFVDAVGNTHKIWANTPQTISSRLGLVSEHNLPGAVFWEYSYGNPAAWDVVRRQLRGL